MIIFSDHTNSNVETTLATPTLKPLFRRYAGRVFASLLAGVVSAGALANGQFESVSGEVRVGPDRVTAKEAVKGGRALGGQTVFTGASGRAVLRFEDGQVLVLNPNTEVKITAYRFDRKQPGGDKVSFDLLRGALRAVTGLIGARNPTAFSMRTPTATIGIRGTDFMVAGLETTDTAELINLADAGTVTSDAGGGLPPMMVAQASQGSIYWLKVNIGKVSASNPMSKMLFDGASNPLGALPKGKAIGRVAPNQLPSAISSTFTELGGVTVSATTTGATTAATNTGGAGGGATAGAGGAVGGASGALTGAAVGAAAGLAAGIAGAAGDTTSGTAGTTGTVQ